MVTQLSVVNECLAIMGEAPLASLDEDHEYRDAVLNKLEEESSRIQTKGWWFNTETLTLTADRSDNRIHIPNDAGTVLVLGYDRNIVQRGSRLYDVSKATDIFPTGTFYKVRFIRVLAMEDLPLSAAEVIRINVLEWFQTQYDGDQTKTRNIQIRKGELTMELSREHIRNLAVNLNDRSERLSRIRRVVRQMNRY